jgi:hypothetical protein
MGPGAEAGTTDGYTSAISRQHSPEFCKFIPPQKTEGAGKTGCALHPRSRVPMHLAKTHTSIQVQRKQSGLPCAMVLRLISCSPRRDLACLSPSPSRSSQELDTSHWGVRTTRFCRPHHAPFVKGASASTAPRPNVSDDGQRPSLGTGWREYAGDLGQESRIISENQKWRGGVKG